MESNGRLAKLEFLISQSKGLDSDRLQALVFIAQTLGESFDYAFDVHHLRVFSRALEADIDFLSTQTISDKSDNSEISRFITKTTQSATLEQTEAAAAFFYFEQKGYPFADIEKSLNADESVLRGAKDLITELKKCGAKQLAASGAN